VAAVFLLSIIIIVYIQYCILGEVSEAQKLELEQSRVTIKQQLAELTELRQQLVKLSEIVDRQTDDMKQLNIEARFVFYDVSLLSCFLLRINDYCSP
jgi:hypothetical protein